MNPYVFQTSFFSLGWENVMIIIGIAGAVWLIMRRSAHKGQAYQDMMLDLAMWLVPAGIIGARTWEMIFTWESYVDAPWDRFAIWKGGMSIQGAVLGGLVALILFARRRQIRVWELLDLAAPSVILGQAVGRIGCLMSGDSFSRPISEVPWLPQWLGVRYAEGTPAWYTYGATPLVPAEAMEGLLDFVILAILLLYRPRREVSGRIVLWYGMLYSAVRFGLEFFRTDSLRFGGLKVAKLLSLATILICGALLVTRYRRQSHTTTEAAG